MERREFHAGGGYKSSRIKEQNTREATHKIVDGIFINKYVHARGAAIRGLFIDIRYYTRSSVLYECVCERVLPRTNNKKVGYFSTVQYQSDHTRDLFIKRVLKRPGVNDRHSGCILYFYFLFIVGGGYTRLIIFSTAPHIHERAGIPSTPRSRDKTIGETLIFLIGD